MAMHIVIGDKRYTLQEYLDKSRKERLDLQNKIKSLKNKTTPEPQFVPFEEDHDKSG